MTTPENPPAFPSPDIISGNNIVPGFYGMSLRDWFAGQALAGLRARNLEGAGEDSKNLNMHHNHAYVCRFANCSAYLARLAFEDADAMLADRAKRKDAS